MQFNYVIKAITTVRSLQAKYDLALKPKALIKPFLKSPICKPLDIFPLAIGLPVNKKLEVSVNEYDTSEFINYKLPMYYIAGEDDWQVPSVVAEKYYHTIQAPRKGFYWMKDAGHAPNLDNPIEFNRIVTEILIEARKYSF